MQLIRAGAAQRVGGTGTLSCRQIPRAVGVLTSRCRGTVARFAGSGVLAHLVLGRLAYELAAVINIAESLPFKTPRERLARVHATTWHEAGHVWHPIPGPWLDGLRQRQADLAPRVEAAFQALEDLRIERELASVRPHSVVWLRYGLGCYGGLVELALKLGKRRDCGWAMAATITAGRAIANVIDRDALHRITRTDKRLAAETARLWDLWDAYASLTDAGST